MKKQIRKEHKLNSEITASEVRLTGEGVISDIYPLSEALRIAEEMGMDLVLLSETSKPPVAKVMNYDKFLYQQSKKSKQKTLDMKEIKVSPNTSDHDLGYRTKQIIEFLNKGHKVKISMKFKGRELIYIDKGKASLLKLVVAIEEYGIPETLPNLEGKQMFIYIKPKTK